MSRTTARSARACVTDAALTFHEATNHVAGFARDPRLLSFTRDEPANVPLTFKEYRGLPTIQLELAPPSREASRAVDVLSRRGFEHRPFDAKALARVLAFVDADVARLVGVDGVQQFPVAVATFGAQVGSASAMPIVAPLTTPDPPLTAGAPTVFPLIRDAHSSGDLSDADAVLKWRSARSCAGIRPPSFEVATPSDRERS